MYNMGAHNFRYLFLTVQQHCLSALEGRAAAWQALRALAHARRNAAAAPTGAAEGEATLCLASSSYYVKTMICHGTAGLA